MTQKDLVAYCQERDILLEAYSPLGTGSIFGNEDVEAVAERNGKSGTSCSALEPSKGFFPLPKSVTPKNIKANLDIFGFDLSEEDMAVLDKIQGIKTQDDPDKVNFNRILINSSGLLFQVNDKRSQDFDNSRHMKLFKHILFSHYHFLL